MDLNLIIDGQVVGENLARIDVINPANGEKVGSIPNGGEIETRQAIDAAETAFKVWSKTTAYERAALLQKLNHLLLEQSDDIARVMTLEMGKPILESKGEVNYSASFIEWYAEEAKRVYGETIPSHVPNKRMQVWRKPIGVVAAITPWNFPLAMITRKIGPALAAGCTVVIKPSKESPLTALKFMDIIAQAGFPNGVVNVVTGSSSKIVGEMMQHDAVKKVTFTGSTEVGKLLVEQSAHQVKQLSLELGGHAPVIVLDDADLDLAVRETIATKFRNTGQTCVCANRIYVQEQVYDAFTNKLSEAVGQLKTGDGLNPDNNIGPLINEAGLEKAEHHIKDAVEKGATVTTGGQRLDIDGLFIEPTVIKDVDPSMIIMQEETFGPVAPVQKIKTAEEGIALANSTPYGLAAYVFTNDVSLGMKVIEQLDFGIVGWNDGAPSAAQAPFGGMKQSGVGREGGRQGIEAFLETQYVSIGI